MATAPSTTPEPHAGWLDDQQHSTLSVCVSNILEQISPRLNSDTDTWDAMFSVFSAVRSACASFAGKFNDSNPRAVTSRLPVDVLTAILYAADMPTRIRASHASRALRNVALAEPGLWTFYRYEASLVQGQPARAPLDFLEAILHRSEPLPIRLDMSHLYISDDDPFVSTLAEVIGPSVHRLQEYRGPDALFNRLNPQEIPLCELVSLDLVCAGLGWGRNQPEPCILRPQWLPNLRSLAAPVVAAVEQPIPSLRELVCAVDTDGSQDVFRCFPNLVRAEFSGGRDRPLPRGPIPRSIEHIIVHCEDDGFDASALRVWAGEIIPRLELLGVQSLAVVSELLAAQAGPIVASISCRRDDFDVTLADAADPSRWYWPIWTQLFWGAQHCAADLQQLFTTAQIVSLTMGLDVLDWVTAAGLDLPHLVSLEVSLTHVGRSPVPTEWRPLRAPLLQHFVLDYGTPNAEASGDPRPAEFEALRQSFRQIIVYEADLLETMTVRSSSRPPEGTDYAYFAQFARRYVDLTPH